MRSVRAEPLTAVAFAPFGQVIEAQGAGASANQGRAERYDAAIDLAAADPRAAKLHTAVYRIEASRLPFEVRVVERHPLSPQLFFPNSGARFLVCTYPTLNDGAPDLEHVHAFIGRREQGIVYRSGVWHSPFVALDEAGDFLMQQWQCGGPLDCEERAVSTPFTVTA